MSLRGTILQLTYRLRYHLCAGWPLSRWLGLLLLLGALGALLYGWPSIWQAILLGLVFLLHIGILAWANRCRYIHFRSEPQANLHLLSTPSPLPLRPEEMVPIRASGEFSVHDNHHYYMDLDADFETVETREHIVLGRVHPSRCLLLGRWPADQLGWWYVFFQPSMIREIQAGHLYFGPLPRLALRILYAPDDNSEERIYLAFDDASTLRRVWDDLLKDAPPLVSG